MATPGLVLIHSPLVGPSSWHPVAEQLRVGDLEVVVPSLVHALGSPPPLYQALSGAVVDVIDGCRAGGGPVLVVHSGAGALVPSVVDAAPGPVRAVVFVDATLPHPGRAWMDTVPAETAEQLRAMAGADGVLPPWHEWFPPQVIAELLPDEGVRTRLCADMPRLPLRYLEEVAPRLPRWRALPCGYLQLSEGYDDAAAKAQASRWPVARVHGHHLSGVTDPATVAAAVVAMAERL
jgi:hypothetical protein